jgi:phosphoribosyl 1,2-cyclic phosphodiesterase
MIGFCPLASGSKGNCIFVGTPQCKILIDAGLSGKQIKLKLAEIGVDIGDIDAILVTHEHSDHIQGLKMLALRWGIPVFANSGTAKGIVDYLGNCPKFKIFSTGEAFQFKDLAIHPFSIQHDTLDPVAFTIKTDCLKMGFLADLGFVTSLVRNQLQDCDYLYVEANHQPSMVHACPRPAVYKQRVLSRSGHLSNEDCGKLLAHVAHPGLKHVHLAHLSSECNTKETALETVSNVLDQHGIKLNLSIAHQEKLSRPILF